MHTRARIDAGTRHRRSTPAWRVALAGAVCVVLAGGAGARTARAETVSTVIPVGNNAQGLAYDSGKGAVFVANAGDGTVSVISDASNSVVATIPVSGAYGPEGVAYDSGKGEVFISDGGAQAVSVISDTTNTVVATVPVPGNPSGVAYDAGRGEVFVGDSGNTVSVISDTTNTVVATVTVGSGTTSLAYDSGRGEIFSANIDGTVSVISDSTNTVVATIAAVGYGAAVYDPARGEVFVANGWPGSITAAGTVSVISDATNTVVATVAVGNTAQGAAYDSGTGEVFVGNHYSNSVTAISDATDTVAVTVGGVGGPTGVAYDAGRGEIFVGNSNFNSVTVIADGAPPRPPLQAQVHDDLFSGLNWGDTTVQPGETVQSVPNWQFDLFDTTGLTPTATMSTGFPPASFQSPNGPLTSFTFSLPNGGKPGFGAGPLTGDYGNYDIAARAGCNWTDSQSPARVAVGGGQVTTTITVTCSDPSVDGLEVRDISPEESQNGSVVGPVTLVSMTPPANLGDGEQPGCFDSGAAGAGCYMGLKNIRTGKTYTFSWTLDVANPFGVPFVFRGDVYVTEETPLPTSCSGCPGPGRSITVADPTLDGGTSGLGAVSFDTGGTEVRWSAARSHDLTMNFSGPFFSSIDLSAPASAVDGTTVTVSGNLHSPPPLSTRAGEPIVFTLGSQSCTGVTDAAGSASCTITLAQPVGTYTLSAAFGGDIYFLLSTSSAAFAITLPTSTDQCKNERWKVFGVFKNQGDCVSYVATGGKNPPG